MVSGGPRKKAGRPPGSANLKTREIANRVAKEGISPLEIMVSIAREFYSEGMALRSLAIREGLQAAGDAKALQEAQDKLTRSDSVLMMANEAANKAAPYIHSRMPAAVELTGKNGAPLEVTRIERVIIDPAIDAVDANIKDNGGHQPLN